MRRASRCITFAISGALAAVAAVLYAPISLLSPTMGELVITKAFVIIVLGGMGSVAGAIVGGLVIGFAEAFGAFYVSTDYKDIIAFALLTLILSVRPQGLFGKRRAMSLGPMTLRSPRSACVCLALSRWLRRLFPLVAPNPYLLSVASLAFIDALAAAGLNLIAGYTGQLNLAHAGFMANRRLYGRHPHRHLRRAVLASLRLPAASSQPPLRRALVGLVSLRLRGQVFAIFTLCVGIIIALLIEKADWLTNGVNGIMDIPRATADRSRSRSTTTPGNITSCSSSSSPACSLMQRIVTSLVGRSFVAIRNGEALAEALGINPMRTKLLAFVLSTFYAGIAGALYAGNLRFLGPGMASETVTFDMITFVIVGGIGTLLGPVVGALGDRLAQPVPASAAGLSHGGARPHPDPAHHVFPAGHRRLDRDAARPPPRGPASTPKLATTKAIAAAALPVPHA